MASISAAQLLSDLRKATDGGSENVIVLTEATPTAGNAANWIAGCPNMPRDALQRFESAVIELRRQHPEIDWAAVETREGEKRRVLE